MQRTLKVFIVQICTVLGKYELKKYTSGHEIFFFPDQSCVLLVKRNEFSINHFCSFYKNKFKRSIRTIFGKMFFMHLSVSALFGKSNFFQSVTAAYCTRKCLRINQYGTCRKKVCAIDQNNVRTTNFFVYRSIICVKMIV